MTDVISSSSPSTVNIESPKRPKRCSICGKSFEEGAPTSTDKSSLPCAPGNCLAFTIEAESGEQPFQLNNHYSMCVFPFTFHEDDGNSFMRLRTSSRWHKRTFSEDDPEDVDRTEYFLPYVKKFLFPSLYEQKGHYDPHADFAVPTVQHYRLDLQSLGPTAEDGSLPFFLSGEDDRDKRHYQHEMSLNEVQLLVTNMRVGFLIFRLRRSGDRPTYMDQMHATLFFRLLAPLYRGFAMPEMQIEDKSFQISQLLGHLLAEFEGDGKARSPERYSRRLDLPVRPSYDDRMMVYTFSCIDHQTCLSDRERARRQLERFAFSRFDDDLSSRIPNDGGDDEAHRWLTQRWQSISKEGSSLVVFDIDSFNREFLGQYHASYYFDIFLLAALQRTALLLLFERLSDIRSLTSLSWESQKSLRRLRKAVLLFKNQSWFSQITHRERGLILWRRWQGVFEVDKLMREVNDQSTELSAYLQDRTRQQVEWGVRIGGFLATSLPAIFGLRVILGKAPWVDSLRWFLVLMVLLGAGIFGWFVLFREEE
ncbi:MAG: hypothetical protein H6728_13480 [Myxococcales bacterium]|nr:hypothetical protein [Myxococcales bacterium]